MMTFQKGHPPYGRARGGYGPQATSFKKGHIGYKGALTHGLSKHPLYDIHSGILYRCYNKEANNYPGYGGRGIGLHAPWHDVAVFIREVEALIGPRPAPHPKDGPWSIDRYPFCNWHYEPFNIRWATMKMQNRNKNDTHWLVIDGQRVDMATASEESGIKYNTLSSRIRTHSHPEGKLFMPPKEVQTISCRGEEHTVKEWSRITGISETTLFNRTRKGLDGEQVLMIPMKEHQITFQGEEHNLREWSRITGISYGALVQRFAAGWSVERALTTPTMNQAEVTRAANAARWAKEKEAA